MNEQIEDALRKVTKTINQWEYEIENKSPTLQTAKSLQFQLSILKLIIGNNNFNELPAFVRYLIEVTKFIEAIDKENNGDNK